MMKQLKDLFDENHLWISTSVTIIGDWSTLDNTTAIDHRIYDFFGDKVIDRSFSQLDNDKITAAVADFINSQVYELDKLYATTEAEYDPIQNYSMSESGTDATYSSSSGDTTDYTTSYNSESENKTGKSAATGSSSTTLTHNFTRSGNIGVTTSQQMIDSELELRKKSVANWLIEFFVKSYMYMLGDVENE